MQDGDLHEHGLDKRLLSWVLAKVTKLEAVPTDWLIKLDHLDLLQHLEAVLDPNRDLLWSV